MPRHASPTAQPSVCVRALNLYRDLRSAAQHYQVGLPYVIQRLRGPLRRRGFHAREALVDGLLDPEIPEEALEGTMAKWRLRQLQGRVNPGVLVPLTEHKALFYAYCSAWGLPVPRFYGLSAQPVGYTASGRPLAGPEDWKQFAAALPAEFVVKPSEGVYGYGFRMFRHDGGCLVDSTGGRFRAEEFDRATRTHPFYHSFVIQERLTCHPELEHLSGTSLLQTLRMVTWIRQDGKVVLPLTVLKVIASDSLTDNYEHGRSGNLISVVDPDSGILETAIGPGPSSGILARHPTHPRTGVKFDGFAVPFWKEACALVHRAALMFVPLRTVGWDVAITAAGPFLVEGNAWWDPFNIGLALTHRTEVSGKMRALLNDLESQAGSKRRTRK